MTRILGLVMAVLLVGGPSAASAVTLGFISDSFSAYPAPALASVRRLEPDAIVVMGDFPHGNPATNVSTATGFLAKARAMWAGLFGGTTRLGADFKAEILDPGVPILLTVLDDHDAARDNVTGSFSYWPEALQAFLETHPVPPNNGFAHGYQYQAARLGPVQVIALDLRTHRETARPKTILGAEQKGWLAAELALAASDPTIEWTVIVSTVPVNPHQKKLDSWSGFHADRDWFHAQVAASGIQNVLVVSGDCHWGSMALPPLVVLPELNIPQLNQGFSRTCDNGNQQWSLNSTDAGTGFGALTLSSRAAELTIYNADGGVRLRTTVPRVP